METDFIHPANTASVATQPLTPAYVAAPAAPPIAVPRPMDASFAAPPARPIGFQPVQQARPAASTFTPPIASPTVLPVVETPVIANQFMAPVEAPSAAAPQRRRLLSMNRLAVAAAFTVFMLGTVGSVYLFIRGQEPGSPGSATRGVVVPEQDLGPEVRLSDVQGGGLPEAQTLIVNGDIRLQGALNFSNGDYLASVVQGNLTTDQAYTLPDVSGEFCLSANNCAYATTVQFAQVETELEALQVLVADPQQLAAGSGIIITGDTIQNSGVLTMNGQSGAVVLTGGSGIVVSGTTITNDGVTSLVGTVNQVNVSGGTGGITLSLPQNIAVTSSPTFAGLTVNGGGTFSGSLAASNLSGTNTGDIAVSGQNYLSLTGQSITVGQVNLGGTHVTGTLPVTQGGTGLNTFNMQGVLYGNGTGALGVTVAGTNGQCLVGNTAAAPSWTSCTAAAGGAAPGGSAGGDLGGTYPNPTIAKLQGTNLLINSPLNGQILVYNTVNSRWDNVSSLSVTSGGTGMTGFTQYGLLFGNATGALGVTVAGTTNECLVGNAAAAPSWIACNVISAGASPGGSAGGDLGGTYPNPTIAKLQGSDILVNLPAAGHLLVYSSTNSRWDNVALTGDVTISQGGVTTIADLTTNGDLLYNNGTTVTRLARGADGQCLATSTTTVLWSSCEGANVILNNGNTIGSAITLGSNDNFGLNFEVNNTTVASFTNTGAVLFKNTANSATAFQIHNAAGTTILLGANTSTGVITIDTLSVTNNLTLGGSLTFGTSISSSCAGLTGYVWVPGSAKFGTLPGFCVMKYEAKNDGVGNAVSTASGTPYVSISQQTAQDKANAACTGCHLISEAEWMTIATNALWQNSNWCLADGSGCGNAPGTASRFLADGHNDNAPAAALAASATDSEACYGTVTAGVNTACGSAGTQKRTLTLSNGAIVWDIPGNVWEWTDSWIFGNEEPNDAVDGFNWHEFTAITKWKDLNYANPTNRGWNSTQRLGQIYTDGTSTNNTLYGFLRGGGWGSGTIAGAFTLNLSDAPAGTSTGIGFRVAR